MAPEGLAILGALALVAVLQLALLLRRPPTDPVLAQRLTDLQAALDRQGERVAALPAEFERGLAREAQAIGERVAAGALDQTRALGEGIGRIADRIAALEAALTDRLAADAKAGREALAEQRAAVVKALSEHKDDTALLRRDVTQGIGEIRLALTEGLARLQETLTAENARGRDLMDAKLRELREGNEAKLGEIQKTVNEQLRSAVEKQMNESFARVSDQFAQVLKAMTDVQVVAAGIGDVKRLFSNVKTRGGWGEAQVRALLDDILPPGSYETNKKLSEDTAEAVEFAIRMPNERGREVFLAVDAKFPTEDWDRLVIASEAGDVEAERAARRALEQRVRAEAAKIAAKYIRPPLTVEFAVLYLPTEGLYAEIARIPGAIEEIGRVNRVMVLGPSLLPAMLRTIQMGHVTIALGEKADLVRELLGATKAEMAKMDEVLARLRKQVTAVGNTLDAAQVRTRAVARKLRGVDALDGPRAAALLEIEAEAEESLGEGDES
ncbi:DNA recombination protein RmuC [Roseomonas alkaliterrae]|uniref:DNA recombination protein RmuC homolog n=1 Tax=Neoroseomonas alkaliterrae TaxID=1452450 RepID=A0A840XIK1_9PROT|nr:DNA recombination protein RmuC [Neoroseomonas alkaliterrae]MBB5688268.1 DNA recombination protein RmuC [Neoroseomonas alkaliterrae]MBR0677132.1 DNA recombination protein RmuC [Neoroseomonas alkaliterrae]